MRLPVAYRSLSRPSSAPDAKAFPLRSYQLDLSVLPQRGFRYQNWFSRIMQAQIGVIVVFVSLIKSPQKNFVTSLLLACNLMLSVQFSRCRSLIFFKVRSKRSSRLKRFDMTLVEISGIEPLTSCLQGRRSPS